jgi:dolichol-phosphate mannosyltransferase
MIKDVSIVLPTYNEKKNISILIPKIESAFKKIKHEIVVVDDSSPDGTAQFALDLNKKYKNIRVVVRNKKEGIGAALREGYNEARYELILSSDSDLSFEVKDMLRLIDEINKGYDVAVGSRQSKKNSYEMQKFSILLKGMVSRFGNKINKLSSGVNIHDFTANFRAIRRNVWKDIHTKDKTNFILAEMLILAHQKGYKVTEIPVTFKDRRYGESKLRMGREIPKFIIKMFVLFLKRRFPKRP